MAEVRVDIDLRHPPVRVWRALTDARLLSSWFMPTDLAPRVGCRFSLEPGALPGFHGPVAAELVEVVAPRRLVMRWRGEDLYTRVVWELSDLPAGCRLRFTQTGFVGAPAVRRRQLLHAGYQRLIAGNLPLVLDRLAEWETVGQPGTGHWSYLDPRRQADLPSLRAAAPAGRPRNTAVAGWAAGRPISALTGGSGRRPAYARRPTDAFPRPGLPPAGIAPQSHRRPSSLPRWPQAVVVAAAAAMAAVVLLAAVVNPGTRDPSRDFAASAPVREQPGMAVQPGTTAATSESDTEPADGAGPPPVQSVSSVVAPPTIVDSLGGDSSGLDSSEGQAADPQPEPSAAGPPTDHVVPSEPAGPPAAGPGPGPPAAGPGPGPPAAGPGPGRGNQPAGPAIEKFNAAMARAGLPPFGEGSVEFPGANRGNQPGARPGADGGGASASRDEPSPA